MNKGPLFTVGLILVALGIVALVWQGVSYTTREKAVDLGPIEITTTKTKTIPLPPILGVVALVGGVALLIASRKR